MDTRRRRGGFTIVEIMVVIGIIALLMGLLMPALSGVRKTGRAMASLSNVRQWGIGTINYAAINKNELPWEGYKDPINMPLNFAEKRWWANAIPPLVGQRPYKELSESATANGATVPLPPDESSIFIDPGAITPPVAPYWSGPTGNQVQFFFCYVPNSQLNNTLQTSAADENPFVKFKMQMISRSEATVLMLEMRTVKEELPPDDPFYNNGLNRHRSDWKRFANRHFDGGHILFADGHADRVSNEYATTNVQGTRDPDEPNGDWNKNDLIWDPLGPATDE